MCIITLLTLNVCVCLIERRQLCDGAINSYVNTHAGDSSYVTAAAMLCRRCVTAFVVMLGGHGWVIGNSSACAWKINNNVRKPFFPFQLFQIIITRGLDRQCLVGVCEMNTAGS